MKITTYTLMKNCKGTKRLDLYLEKYKDELFDKPLHVYLRSLAVEKGISPAQIATQYRASRNFAAVRRCRGDCY